MIDVIIDSNIKLNLDDFKNSVGEKALAEIYNALTIPNPRKILAEREMLWGFNDIPDDIELYKFDYNKLILPRGFINNLEDILEDSNLKFSCYNKTKRIYNSDIFKEISINLRYYQKFSVNNLLAYSNGIYKAPTGSGKTRVMLEVIRQAGQKTLVIIEKQDIFSQWIKSAQDLGFKSVGLFGGKSFRMDNEDLVIATRQILWSKASELEKEKWFDQWGMVVVDECHHVTSDTMWDLVQRFPAYYRFGCSATPDADPDLFPIAQAVLGPVVAESTVEEIGEHLVIPSVRVVNTNFEFPYRPTMRQGNKVIRNNYNAMCKDLEEDYNRNELIIKHALEEANKGYSCLIISKRKKHIDNLFILAEDLQEQYVDLPINFFYLTGDNSDESYNIALGVDKNSAGSILFSTLADEGTDIPRLDRLFLAYPGRKLRGYEQAIGRIMRPHPKKKDAIVYDFRDVKVSLLNSQYRFRAQGIYNKKNYKVETIV